MNLVKILSFFVTISVSRCLGSRKEFNRNLLHFSNAAGWQGPPAALYNLNNTLRLYYEQPVDLIQGNSTTQMKWAQASTTDGMKWKDEVPFLTETPGSSSCSYYQGGMINWPYDNLKNAILVFAEQRCPPDQSVVNHVVRFTMDGINLIETSKHTITSFTSFSLFLFEGKLFSALIRNCEVVAFGSIKGNFSVNLSTGLETGLSGNCRGLQIHPLNNDIWIISLSHDESPLSTQTKYWYGKFTRKNEDIEFNPEPHFIHGPYILDYGHDAQDFKFGFFHGKTVTIGWNGNQLYPNSYPQNGWKNSMTIPRYINGIENGRLTQEPFSFSTKAIKAGIKLTQNDLLLKTKSCYKSVDLSLVEPKKNGAFIFHLEFMHNDDFKRAGFQIHFKSTVKNPDVLTVTFNPDAAESIPAYKLTVDRSQTDISWGAKNNLASADIVGDPRYMNPVPIKTVPMTIILDHTTIEVYVLNGTSVITLSYFRKNKEPLNMVCINSINDESNVILDKKSSYGKYAGLWTDVAPKEAQPSSSASLSLTVAIVSSLLFFI